MRLLPLVVFLLFTTFIYYPALARVRHVALKKDEITTVKTSLGLATIVQVPGTPTRLVIGNKSAFKVEYLDKAITIKPLTVSARTNLYVYTNNNRYNIKLVSTQRHLADYVVYLKSKPKPEPEIRPKPRDKLKANSEKQPDILKNIRWRKYRKFLNNEEIRLIVNKIGFTKKGIYIIDFTIHSIETLRVNPRWIKITQKKKIIPIYKLFFDGLSLTPQRSVSGLVVLKKENLSYRLPIRMEFHRNRISHLTIKEIKKW